jgi:hypothetical protein
MGPGSDVRDDGSCHGCGVPSRAQYGSLVLQASKLPKGPLWMPNWQFDALCARVPETSAVLEGFAVRTLPVHTPRSRDTGIVQILATTTAAPWYDEANLRKAAAARRRRTAVCDLRNVALVSGPLRGSPDGADRCLVGRSANRRQPRVVRGRLECPPSTAVPPRPRRSTRRATPPGLVSRERSIGTASANLSRPTPAAMNTKGSHALRRRTPEAARPGRSRS